MMAYYTSALGLLHVCRYKKHAFGIVGKSRSLLQKSAVRKFLNYDAKFRNQIKHGEILMAVGHDAFTAVQDGYSNVIALVRATGKLLSLLAFQIIYPVIFETRTSYEMLVAFLLLPAVFYACSILRVPSTLKVLTDI